MRYLAIAISVLAALWSGYWVLGAFAFDRRAEAWLESLRAEGWLAEAEVSVSGFPNRFDLTLKDMALSDPVSGLAWEAPRFQVLILSYRWNHVILVWPDEQEILSPSGGLTVSTEKMRGSIRLRGGGDRVLESSRVVVEGLKVASPPDWRAGAASVLFALEPHSEGEAVYRVGFGVEDLLLPRGPALPPDADGGPTVRVERINVDATAVFDAPLGLEGDLPRLVGVGIDEAWARWRDVDVRATGGLDISPDGVADGRITLKIENWRGLLTFGVNAGYVPRAAVPSAEALLTAFAGGGNTLEAPLIFDGGNLWLGVIPLGRAPRFAIR